MPAEAPEQLFSDLLAADPGRPFVTYYDERTGERSELSLKSLANWVAKTHFLLIDELGLGVGDTALVDVPAHWISVPVLFGCLSAGLAITPDEAGTAAVAFVDPQTVGSAADVPDVYALAPESAATGFGDDAPAGTADYVRAVRTQPDKWPTVRFGATPDDPGLPGMSRREVVEAARARAAELGLAPGARVLSTRAWRGPADWLDVVLAPLTVGGSVVLVANCSDDAVLERRMTQERVTSRV